MRIKGTLLLVAILAGGCGGNSDDNRPTATFTAECTDFLCEFDASASRTARGGTELQYAWDFGDGTGSFGEIAEHAYGESGEYTVRLTVVDQFGSRDFASETVSITASPLVDYYHPVRRSLSSMLFLQETFVPLVESSDAIQDAAEAEGVPDADGNSVACPVSGTVQVSNWTDGNSNLLVDNGETITIKPVNCSVSEDRSLDSPASFDLIDDFDGATFGIAHPADTGFGIATEILDLWSYRGSLDFTATRSSGELVALQAISPEANIVYRADDGGPSLIIPASFDLSRNIPALSGIDGNMTYRFGQGASDKETTLTILSPITIEESNGDLLITAGSFSVAYDTIEITATIDADPAYLAIDVDTNADGTTDLSGRFPQNLTLLRFKD